MNSSCSYLGDVKRKPVTELDFGSRELIHPRDKALGVSHHQSRKTCPGCTYTFVAYTSTEHERQLATSAPKDASWHAVFLSKSAASPRKGSHKHLIEYINA